MDQGEFSSELLDKAVGAFQDKPLPAGKKVRELPKKPSVFQIEYNDGLKGSVVTLDNGLAEFAAAWKYEDGETAAFLYRLQEDHPFAHFTNLLQGVEQMMHTGKPTWATERTLMTSGLLDSLLVSRKNGGEYLDTPFLNIKYQTDWNWKEPAPMPPFTPKPKPVKK
jgi:hypothetical protein